MHKRAVRTHARQWTTTLLATAASELERVAARAPGLISEWLAELTWCRERWPQETELFDGAIEKLEAARNSTDVMRSSRSAADSIKTRGK